MILYVCVCICVQHDGGLWAKHVFTNARGILWLRIKSVAYLQHFTVHSKESRNASPSNLHSKVSRWPNQLRFGHFSEKESSPSKCPSHTWLPREDDGIWQCMVPICSNISCPSVQPGELNSNETASHKLGDMKRTMRLWQPIQIYIYIYIFKIFTLAAFKKTS